MKATASPLIMTLNQEAMNRNVRVMKNLMKDLKTCKASASKSSEKFNSSKASNTVSGTLKSMSLKHHKGHKSSEFSTTLEQIKRMKPRRKDTNFHKPATFGNSINRFSSRD